MTPRCTTRGCPVRWSSGGHDRPCQLHADDDGDTLAGRMAAFEALAAPPGDYDHDTDETTTGRIQDHDRAR
jgi:hypothetical protein